MLPFPMHTIYASQHSRKPVHRPVHFHQTLAVFGCRLSKIPMPKYANDAPTKNSPNTRGQSSRLCEGTRQTCWSCLRRPTAPDCSSALLYERVTGSTTRILLKQKYLYRRSKAFTILINSGRCILKCRRKKVSPNRGCSAK